MIDRDTFDKRARVRHPLAGEYKPTGPTRVAPFNPEMGTIVPGARRIDIAHRYVSDAAKLWARKVGSIDSADPAGFDSLFAKPSEPDDYLMVNWNRLEMAAWFSGDVPDNQTLAAQSLRLSGDMLKERLNTNMAGSIRNRVEFSCLVDIALGVELAAAAPRWGEVATTYGVDLARDVISADIKASHLGFADQQKSPSAGNAVMEEFVRALVLTQRGDAIDTQSKAIEVVRERVIEEQASPQVHPSYWTCIGKEELAYMRQLQNTPENRDKFVIADWVASNLRDPGVESQRVFLPRYVDSFFVLIGVDMLKEFATHMSREAIIQGSLLKDANRRRLKI